MKAYEATEAAYRNGYAQGMKDAKVWFPVSERLPAFNIPVLTYLRNGMIAIGYTQPASASPDGKVHFYPRTGSDVTHWIPLPQPPTSTTYEIKKGNAI